MKNSKKIVSVLLSLITVFTALPPNPVLAQKTQEEYFEQIDNYNMDDSIPKYADYLSALPKVRPSSEIVIDAASYVSYTENDVSVTPEVYENYKGMEGASIYSGENSIIEYSFNVAEAGLYDLSLLYYPIPGKSGAIQRSVFIDGAIPFKEFALVEFYRMWGAVAGVPYEDDKGVTRLTWEKDNQGNDLKPSVIELPDWIESGFYDYNGFILDELAVYLEQGQHTITLVSMREPMIMRGITLKNNEETINYADKKAMWDSMGYSNTAGHVIRVEAENYSRSSSQMLYPDQDQSSPSVYPMGAKELLNNSIGGGNWGESGQWLEWEFSVPESGYYNISLNALQNFQKGISVTRKITIDGEAPFTELLNKKFAYKQNWREEVLADENGNAYMIYLEAGTHTLKMETALGDFADIISLMQDTVYDLNEIYRDVIRILGVSPDKFRDYQLERSIPGLEGKLTAARDNLNTVIAMLEDAAEEKSDKAAVLLTMRDQLNELIADREHFTKTVADYRKNARACGSWIPPVMAQPLQLDSIFIYSPGEKADIKKAAWYEILWFELKRLFYSFIIDYNQIGNVSSKEDTKTITLWVGTGRDQANIVKTLIDKSFTNNMDINVNVMIVDMSTLLQATLSGQGPDVAIQVGNDVPMNYGLRNAVLDLSQFPDLNQVTQRFFPSSMVAMRYEDYTFGLPETQTFPMMFYRKDILRDLGLELPNTWDDVKVAMTILAKNQMEFGMFPVEQNFATLLFQNGGEYYTEDATKSALDSEEAINTFKIYCNYYTDYKLDKITSVDERFRTGEAPIIVTDYTFYNTLQVSAPDIKGLWDFAPVPATVKANGELDRSVASAGNACIIMNAAKDKESSWEFLKWWTSSETQTLFGRELESLLGSSARLATANIEAFSMLPWKRSEYEALSEQFATAKGIRQVPGGYYSFRNVNNAFYRVTNDISTIFSTKSRVGTVSPREELTDKVLLINDEIRYKRTEFGMPLAE
ncbi:MAG: extracellular solute-binding protein [Clostridiales bacterium]|nr:extracellular solute-binding protein [Clostridiales bacterium]